MRRKVFVAESALRNKSPIHGLCSLEGEAGADLAVGSTLKSVPWDTGKSRDTVRFGGLIENLGIGKELGGGEFEYAGPAHRSEKGKYSFTRPISSQKDVSFLGTVTLMVMGELFEMVLK